jgi:hypothetical protein
MAELSTISEGVQSVSSIIKLCMLFTASVKWRSQPWWKAPLLPPLLLYMQNDWGKGKDYPFMYGLYMEEVAEKKSFFITV